MERGLEILNMVLHVFGRVNRVHQFQIAYPCANIMYILLAQNNAGMLLSGRCQFNEVRVKRA